MCLIATLALCLLAVDTSPLRQDPSPPAAPRVVLVPNTTVLLQRDVLLLMSVVENRGKADIRLTYEDAKNWGDYAAIFLRHEREGGWRRIRTMQEVRLGFNACVNGRAERIVLAGSSYAECSVLHCEGKAIGFPREVIESFAFEQTGNYELKAVVRTASGILESKPVTITVKPRPQAHLERILESAFELRYVESLSSKWTAEDERELKSLQDLGGNTARCIAPLLAIQEFQTRGTLHGKVASLDEVCRYIDATFDPVNRELARLRLGLHFRTFGDWESLRTIAATSQYDSNGRRESLRKLRFLVDPTAAQTWTRHDLGGNGFEPVVTD